jgi:predicted methyltransferase
MSGIEALVNSYGAHARPVREVIAALTDRSWTLAELVQATAVPRRTVEEVIAALDDDLDTAALRIRPEKVAAYRQLFGYDQLRRTAVPDPLLARADAATDLRAELATLIAAAPVSRRALDHVAATPETAAWRGLWLDSRYDLAGAHLLCVGDHDLTSLAAALVNPELTVTVVDLDERILEFIDIEARRRGLDVRCYFADLRLGLPPSAVASADLAFTDPPYTPEGVQLFLARAAEGLRDRERGRLVMAYGYSDRTPALGLKVQQSVQELALAYEAILPAVNRYAGAQAVGSASDVYVCRPTARTWKVLDRAVESAVNIYTHGPQSLEGAGPSLPPEVARAVLAEAGAVTGVIGDSWPGPITRARLSTVLASGLPPALAARGSAVVAVDLAADPGPWLLRTLLAVNADRLALLVPNSHPDVASEAGQRALAELVGGKYSLRYRRSTPGPEHAIVVATRVPGSRGILDRAHGRIGNVWREALIGAREERQGPDEQRQGSGEQRQGSGEQRQGPGEARGEARQGPNEQRQGSGEARQGSGEARLSKNEARAAVRAATARPELLDRSLVELPRHQLGPLLAEVAASRSHRSDREA